MLKRLVDCDNGRWTVTTTGRVTQYGKDEFSLLFTRVSGGPREERVARYSPLGAKSREASLAELSDEQLRWLIRHSQPSWTTPELGYRR